MSTTVLERTNPRDGSERPRPPQIKRGLILPRFVSVVAWASVFGAVIVVAAGFAPAAEQRSGATRLYSLGAREAEATSVIRGTVAVTAEGCVGLKTGDEILTVIWPRSTVLLSETEVRIPGGSVARVGDRIVLGGSRVRNDPDLGVIAYACGAGDEVLLTVAGAS